VRSELARLEIDIELEEARVDELERYIIHTWMDTLQLKKDVKKIKKRLLKLKERLIELKEVQHE